jgi:putative polyhydroxyalkanoate system protein
MSKIEISKDFSNPLQEVREGLEQLSQQLEQHYGLEHQWQGDTIEFKHKFVKGNLVVREGHLALAMKLSLMARPFEKKIRAEIEGFLDKHLHA